MVWGIAVEVIGSVSVMAMNLSGYNRKGADWVSVCLCVSGLEFRWDNEEFAFLGGTCTKPVSVLLAKATFGL